MNENIEECIIHCKIRNCYGKYVLVLGVGVDMGVGVRVCAGLCKDMRVVGHNVKCNRLWVKKIQFSLTSKSFLSVL